jgi:hypothetical protein
MAAITEKTQFHPFQGIEEWACRSVRQWCEICDEFKETTRKTMLDRQPSASELEQHRAGMKMLLRITRMMHAEVADPDFPDRSLANEVAIRLRQMEDLWEIIHAPMPDQEADKLLREVFPE